MKAIIITINIIYKRIRRA